MKIIYQKISEIKPYENNPRMISKYAIDEVAQSIKEFGFKQPIVVDKKNVIIVGHTRFLAAKKLKLESVPTLIADLSEKKANEYRIIDNSSSEKSEWNIDKLFDELEQIEKGTFTGFNFEEIEKSVSDMLDQVDEKHEKQKDTKREKDDRETYKLVSYDRKKIDEAYKYLSEVLNGVAEFDQHF